ncbi:MAG: peptidoglycan recognition family protein [Deferrisomatales bacterium]|nr:peptidoglycan recognition family protein [Deferrisomatales bacterium]
MGTRAGALLLGLALYALGLPGATSAAEDPAARLDEVRRRLRAEAGVAKVPAQDADLPLVALTVLPGDTHARLARELTGNPDAEAVLRKVEPVLRPGAKIYVPRALLLPGLADPRLEPVALGGPYPTLWRLVQDGTDHRLPGVPGAVRNLQRLNAVTDPTRIHRGARILVPRSLLTAAPVPAAPALRLRSEFRATDLSGLERRFSPNDLPESLRRKLRREGRWARQLERRETDLVVIHTTEHQGAPFENVARFIQRNRLANYLIGPDGTVYEIVPEAYRSFGCGQSLWEGRYVVDHEAINVEIFANTAPGRTGGGIRDQQYRGLQALLAQIRARRPVIHEGRIVTHRMVAVSYRYGTRSRKGDPYEFNWARAGLPDNSQSLDQDVLLGRAKLTTDERYTHRVTPGQTAAARLLHNL